MRMETKHEISNFSHIGYAVSRGPSTKLPTEGTDPVVIPAMDHIYTKAILDLSNGPVLVELPEVTADRYFSIQHEPLQ